MRNNKQGFTMVELLVVLVIVAILAAVATPIYLANVQRSRATEAVSAMGLIRQAMRDYKVTKNTYFDIVANGDVGYVQNSLPTSVASGAPTPNTAGIAIDLGTTQYFSNGSFTVESTAGTLSDTNGASDLFVNPLASDSENFIIKANGGTTATGLFGANRPCASGFTGNCSTKGGEVSTYRLEMDNSGRTFVSYDSGTTWTAY